MDATQIAQIESEMEAQGVPTHEVVQEDYFGFEESHTTYLPDGVSYVQHRTLNEGARKLYQKSVNRDVRIQKTTQDAILSVNPADERHALIRAALTGWNLTRGGQPVPFSARTVDDFLEKAAPSIVDLIEKAIRAANPWLTADATLEDLLKEREELDTLIAKKREEAAGKSDS